MKRNGIGAMLEEDRGQNGPGGALHVPNAFNVASRQKQSTD